MGVGTRDRTLPDDVLGELAVETGLVSPEQVSEARRLSRTEDIDLADALLRLDSIGPHDRERLERWAEERRDRPPDPPPTEEAGAPLPADGPAEPEFDPEAITHRRRPRPRAAPSPDPSFRRLLDSVTPEADERYDLAEELGRGGIGRVVIGFDRHLGRQVAIKELLSTTSLELTTASGAADPDLVRFLREARVTGQLEHPSIVPVYELGRRSDGTVYYAMKRVRGRTLRQALRSASSLPDRLRMLDRFVDVCNAIAYAHSRGVIHRDIKPDNVMLGEFGETVVLDWGLTKLRNEDDRVGARPGGTIRRNFDAIGSEASDSNTRAGEIMGTPAYMSPEQADGDIEMVDERSDVWSLGAVLFELLTGRPPFKSPRVEDTLWKVSTSSVPSILELEPSAPRDLAAVAHKALSRDRNRRYPNAAAMVEDIDAWRNGARVTAYRYSAWELVTKFVREHRVAALGGFAFLLAVAAGSIATYVAYRQAVAQRVKAVAAERQANQNLSTAELEKSATLRSQRDYAAAAVYAAAAQYSSPWEASSRLPYPDLEQRTTEDRSQALLAVRSAVYDTLTRRVLSFARSFATGEACVSELTAGGSRLLVVNRDLQLTEWDTETQTRLRTVDVGVCPFDLSSADDGRTVVAVDTRRGAWLISLPSGTKRSLDVEGHRVRNVAIGRGGRYIYATTDGDRLLRLDSRTLAVEASAAVDTPKSVAVSPNGRFVVVGNRWGHVVRFDARSLRHLETHQDHGSSVWAIAFTPDGRRFATAGYEGNIVVRDLFQPDFRLRLPADNLILDLEFHPSGRLLVSAGFERAALWSVRDGSLIQVFKHYERGVRDVEIADDGTTVVTSGYGPTTDVWSLRPAVMQQWFGGHAVYPNAIAVAGTHMVTADTEGRLRSWDLTDGRLHWVRNEDAVQALAIAAAADRIYSITSRGRVREWDTDGSSRVLRPEFESVTKSFKSIDARRDGRRIYWSDEQPGVAVYDRDQDSVIDRLVGVATRVRSLRLSPDERTLAAGDDLGNLVVWDLSSGRIRWQVDGAHEGLISDIVFRGPDELLTCGEDASIREWKRGQAGRVLRGHREGVNWIDLSPDGKTLISSSDDPSVRVWDLDTGLPRLELPSEHPVVGLAFLPDGRSFAAGMGPWVRILPVTSPAGDQSAAELLRDAEAMAGRKLDGFQLRSSVAADVPEAR
jgi:serine/threonine protein kinase/WD40 repeat protein